MADFTSVLLEIHQMDVGVAFVAGSRYVITEGQFKPARPFVMPLSQREFLRLLHRLRYSDGMLHSKDAREALAELGAHVHAILACDLTPKDHPLQIDLVSNAPELWALPFEACLDADGTPSFADRNPPVVLTRRIRHGLADRAASLPARPHVLFITAAEGPDLSRALIEANRKALEDGLRPWLEPVAGLGAPKNAGSVLANLKNPSRQEIADECNEARAKGEPFTHIHILAHGVRMAGEIPGEEWWGLRLGGGAPLQPEELAQAIAPSAGLPAVVVVAACDSANQQAPFSQEKSFAQELHKAGVPVVVGSQLPLQKRGTQILSQHFYAKLFQGEDVRLALHTARAELRRDPRTGHDWASVVAYVQLPEGYGDLLIEAGLRAELALLEAADSAAGELAKQDHPPEEVSRHIEKTLRERIESLLSKRSNLDGRRLPGDPMEEADGLLGSAHKRLAQILFDRAEREKSPGFVIESLEILATAREYYKRAYLDNPRRHWVGAQWLSLAAILEGRIDDVMEWEFQLRIAEAAVRKNEEDYWACGTLMELLLMARLVAGREERVTEAGSTLEKMKQRVQQYGKDDFPLRSTRRQLQRYSRWWTRPNGFFREAERDLANEAETLLKLLPESPIQLCKRNGGKP